MEWRVWVCWPVRVPPLSSHLTTIRWDSDWRWIDISWCHLIIAADYRSWHKLTIRNRQTNKIHTKELEWIITQQGSDSVSSDIQLVFAQILFAFFVEIKHIHNYIHIFQPFFFSNNPPWIWQCTKTEMCHVLQWIDDVENFSTLDLSMMLQSLLLRLAIVEWSEMLYMLSIW